jgi:hypothetical protein
MWTLTKWDLKGDYFEACNCEVNCPCIFLSPPTGDDCTVLLAWHVNKGKFGDTKLDGLNVALAIYSPGHMQKVKWKAALYLDSSASKVQADVLAQIYGGKHGGNPAGLAPFIGEMLGAKTVPIKYNVSGNRRSLNIPDVTYLEVEDVPGAKGTKSTIQNAPFAEPLVFVAKSNRFTYADYGMNWEISNKNSFHSPFSWKGS